MRRQSAAGANSRHRQCFSQSFGFAEAFLLVGKTFQYINFPVKKLPAISALLICAIMSYAQTYTVSLSESIPTAPFAEPDGEKIVLEKSGSENSTNAYLKLADAKANENARKNKIFSLDVRNGEKTRVDDIEFPLYEKASLDIEVKKIDGGYLELIVSATSISKGKIIEKNLFAPDNITEITHIYKFKIEKNLPADKKLLVDIESICTVRDGVPILADIPILGRLFQSKGQSRQIRCLEIEIAEKNK